MWPNNGLFEDHNNIFILVDFHFSRKYRSSGVFKIWNIVKFAKVIKLGFFLKSNKKKKNKRIYLLQTLSTVIITSAPIELFYYQEKIVKILIGTK